MTALWLLASSAHFTAGTTAVWDRYFCRLRVGFLAASRGACSSGRESPMTVFTGHTGNAGHFLQPTASAMGHRTTPFSEEPRPLAYAFSRVAPQRAYGLARVIARAAGAGKSCAWRIRSQAAVGA